MNRFSIRKLAGLFNLLVLSLLVLAACQPAATSTPTTVPTQPAAATALPQATSTQEAAIPNTAGEGEAEISVVEDPELGEILVGNNGMTLYMFTEDEPNQVNCEGGCLANWPPLVTEGSPVLGEGVDPALVGTADLGDGRKIVTYNEMPLYYWANDAKPGDTTGQGVGDVWYVVSPAGEVIGMPEPAMESTATMAAPDTTATPAASDTTTTPAADSAMAAEEAEISVVDDPKLGEILVGNNGMTLYMFTKDEENKVNCAGECLVKWPPLLTQGNPTLGEGVDPDLVGTADLPDGSKIVTYNGMPLYYWINDKKAGDTTGQGVGEVWYVVSPAGEVIGMTAAAELPATGAMEAEINVVDDPKLGEILVGNNGMTLYMFTKDEENKVNCAGECLVKWPPLLTQGSPKLGEGVDADLVGTADLPDGSKIVTYNGMPLYYWINDKKAGDTTGQGVGEVWYVVAPDGTVIQ